MSKEIRLEIRKLEKEILSRDKELNTLKSEKMKLGKEVKDDQATVHKLETRNKALGISIVEKPKPQIKFVENKKDLGSRTSSPKFQVRSPYSPGRMSAKSVTSVSSRRRRKKQEEEEKRNKLMTDVEKNLVSGEAVLLLDALKSVGKSGQGVASKLIELNRQQFK